MIIEFLKKIFYDKKTDKTPIKEVKETTDLKKQFLEEELKKVDYFLLEKKDILLKHIKDEVNLNKSDNLLTKEEKNRIGVNVRLKITKELLSIFDTSKLKEQNPKELLQDLYFRINSKIMKIEEIKRIKEADITKVKLSSSGDGATCKWCLSMDNKTIDITKTDLIELIENNCDCDYNRSSILAVFDN